MYIESGYLKNRKISVPNVKLRPTTSIVKLALFNTLKKHIKNKKFLDCFAGTGLVGFEAVSQGASQVGFVEINKISVDYLNKNIQKLNITDKTTIKQQDVFNFLESTNEQWDIVFFSPPYDTIHWYQLFRSIEASPLIKNSSLVIIQHPQKVNLEPLTLKTLEVRKYGYNKLSFFKHPQSQNNSYPQNPKEEF